MKTGQKCRRNERGKGEGSKNIICHNWFVLAILELTQVNMKRKEESRQQRQEILLNCEDICGMVYEERVLLGYVIKQKYLRRKNS